MESEFGARYTELFGLPYYDAVRMVVVDPMHNLFLGTAKTALRLWMKEGILTEKHLADISHELKTLKVPEEVGRVLRLIEEDADVTGFTADQMKLWTLTLSLAVLKGRLPEEHLEVWRLFVQANIFLSPHALPMDDVTRGDQFLHDFCVQFQAMYGQDAMTPNMHLHHHLRDCILDFGPLAAFWAFGFERFNGILGYMPNSHRSVEVDLLRRFSREGGTVLEANRLDVPEFEPLMKDIQPATSGSLIEGGHVDESAFLLFQAALSPFEPAKGNEPYGEALKPFTSQMLNEVRYHLLQQYYNQAYPNESLNVGRLVSVFGFFFFFFFS